MALILKDGSVFLHIPKTGGNWVTKVLRQQDLVAGEIGHKHCDIDHFLSADLVRSPLAHAMYLLRRKLHKKRSLPIRQPFMFTFVRHPLIWYESWWKYQNFKRKWRSWGNSLDPLDWHPASMLNGTGDPDFNRFVRNAIDKRPGYVSELYGLYTRPDHAMFVGKQETLREDLVEVLKRLELPFDESLLVNTADVNVSMSSPSPIVWDSEVKQEILRLEYRAIKAFGYDRLQTV